MSSKHESSPKDTTLERNQAGLPGITVEEIGLAIPFQNLSTETVFSLIATDLLKVEDCCYRAGEPLQADHKLLFLLGGPEKDVRIAVDSRGERIYTKAAAHPKAPEIPEATAAISAYFELERNLPRVLSEVADIFWNITQLTQLDPKFKETYNCCIYQLASALGLSIRESLLLTLAKYKLRLIDNEGKKSPQQEEELIAKMLEPDSAESKVLIPTPTDENIEAAFQLINLMASNVLQPRLLQWQTVKAWQETKP